MKNNRGWVSFLILFVFSFVLQDKAVAAVREWDGEAGTLYPYWSLGENWVGNVAPASGDAVSIPAGNATLFNMDGLQLESLTGGKMYIYHASLAVVFDETMEQVIQDGGLHWVGNLDVANYELRDGQLKAESETMHYFVQQGGDHIAAEFTTADSASNDIQYLMYDGAFTTVTKEVIGDSGWADFVQNGGTHTHLGGGDGLIIGSGENAVARYFLSGGELIVNGDETVADRAQVVYDHGEPAASVGFYSNSSHTVGGSLYIARQTGSGGYFNLGSNTLSVGLDEYVGCAGLGELEQTGNSQNTIKRDLYVGYAAGSQGAYQLWGTDGASVNVGNDTLIGYGGVGEFNQSYATVHDVARDMYLGYYAGSAGNYSMMGGELNAGRDVVVGFQGDGKFHQIETFDFVPAVVNVTGKMVIGFAGYGEYLLNGKLPQTYCSVGGGVVLGEQPTGYGAAYLNGGKFSVGEDLVIGAAGQGYFENRGQVTVDGDVVIAGGPAGSRGTLSQQAGSLSAGNIVNNDRFDYGGGTVQANVVNSLGATFALSGPGERVINGNVENNGIFDVQQTTVRVTGDFVNNWALHSDPSELYFKNLTVAAQGYISASAGDKYYVSGSFSSLSERYADWSTREANLIFDGGETMNLSYVARDLGSDPSGFDNNFAWGALELPEAATLNLNNSVLYAELVDHAVVNDDTISNLVGDGKIYYLASLDANKYLGGKTYGFAVGSGQMIPVTAAPEPVSSVLFLLGSGVLGARVLRKKL